MTLLERVAAVLSERGTAHALIGAAALAVHGVSRSTLGQDLLVDDRRVLDSDFWLPLATEATVDIRRGDSQDKWDIEQLLAVDSSAETRLAVDERISVLPARSREIWASFRPRD